MARHDVLLYEDAGYWRVEHRIGGSEGWTRWYEHDDEDGALDRVRDLLATSDSWQDLP